MKLLGQLKTGTDYTEKPRMLEKIWQSTQRLYLTFFTATHSKIGHHCFDGHCSVETENHLYSWSLTLHSSVYKLP